ncbi:MAG: ATP-binding protein [Chitinophagaceae bacterium]
MQTQREVILYIIVTGFLFFILISFILTMLFFHKRRQISFLKEVELIKANFEKELLKTQLEIQEETFQHISLELHDNVGHFLSLAKLHLTTLNGSVPKQVNEKLEDSVQLITCSLNEIRNISRSLNTENIRSNGLIKTVEQQVEQLQKSGQFKINFIVSGKTCYMDDQKEIVLFRIVQEVLNNIVKHSNAAVVDVRMDYDEHHLCLNITDNGVGFNVEDALKQEMQNSSGLKNIIKRSSLINAVHQINSEPGKGTIINIITPY